MDKTAIGNKYINSIRVVIKHLMLSTVTFYCVNQKIWKNEESFKCLKITGTETVNFYSAFNDVNDGVPHHTMLGPTLFPLYINDIGNFIENGEAILYADDTALIFSGKKWKRVRKKQKLG